MAALFLTIAVLIIGCGTTGLQLAGVINMQIARWLFAVAWCLAIVTVLVADENTFGSRQAKSFSLVGTALIVGAVLISLNRWMTKVAKLEIVYEPDLPPFVQINRDPDGTPVQTLYRVGVISTVMAEVVLCANNVRLGEGGPYFAIPLHLMHGANNKLYPNTVKYWDVILVGSETNSILLFHNQKNLSWELPPGSQEFQLLASTDKGPPTAKTVVIEVGEDNKVHFRLRDVARA